MLHCQQYSLLGDLDDLVDMVVLALILEAIAAQSLSAGLLRGLTARLELDDLINLSHHTNTQKPGM